jgi:hypothetical protein
MSALATVSISLGVIVVGAASALTRANRVRSGPRRPGMDHLAQAPVAALRGVMPSSARPECEPSTQRVGVTRYVQLVRTETSRTSRRCRSDCCGWPSGTRIGRSNALSARNRAPACLPTPGRASRHAGAVGEQGDPRVRPMARAEPENWAVRSELEPGLRRACEVMRWPLPTAACTRPCCARRPGRRAHSPSSASHCGIEAVAPSTSKTVRVKIFGARCSGIH